MRRVVPMLVLGALIVVLLLGMEKPPEPPTPFLAVAEPVEGAPFVVRSADRRPGAAGPTYLIRRVDGDLERARSGEPCAVAAGARGQLVTFFADQEGATVLHWSDAADATIDWERITGPAPGFRAVAATALTDGGIVVVGSVGGDSRSVVAGSVAGDYGPGSLRWGRVTEGAIVLAGDLPVPARFARHACLVRRPLRAALVWVETAASGMELKTIPVPPPEGAEPRTLHTLSEVRALVGLESLQSVLVIRDDRRVEVVALDGGESTTGSVDGLPSGDTVRFAATAEPPRLLALASGRILTWPLEGDGRPARGAPEFLNPSPDRTFILLSVAMAAALAMVALIAVSGRGVGITVAGRIAGELEYAGLGRRLLAFLLDTALVNALGAWIVAAFSDADPWPLLGLPIRLPAGHEMMLVLLVEGLVLLYFIVAEALCGQTLGKRALMIRTVRLDGERAPLGAIVARNLLRQLVDLNGGGFLAFVSAKRQRVGDWAARTVVVRMRRLMLPDPSLSDPTDEAESRSKMGE